MRRLNVLRPRARRWPLSTLPAAGASALLFAACGAAASPSTSGGSHSMAMSPTAGTAATIKTGMATVGSSSETVLTDANGATLYYFVPDTPTTSKCSGTCAGYWPPVLLPSGQPSASGSLPGKLSVVTDANGQQVQYNGHFLYRFSGDSGPGQAKGNGRNLSGGLWYVATPSLSAGSGAAPSSSSSPGGYGGY